MGELGKNKGGRPRLINKLTSDDLSKIERLAGVGLTVEEIAYIFRLSKKTFERRLKEASGGFDALQKGRILAGAEVKKTAFDLAVSGECPAMTMFWLKCRENWSEKAGEKQEPLMSVNIQNNHASLIPQGNNTKVQTVALLREALGLPKAKPPDAFTGGQDVD